MAAGRPTKFSDENQRQVMLLAKKGFTDKEIAEVLAITPQTLNNWKKTHKEFFASLKEAKIDADRKVERSLYERACGYSHPEVHITSYLGQITITDITKHYPPDPTSMIYWLKNRQPEKWRDIRQQEGDDGIDWENIGFRAAEAADISTDTPSSTDGTEE